MTETNNKANKTVRKVPSKTKNNSPYGCQCGCGSPNKQTSKKPKA